MKYSQIKPLTLQESLLFILDGLNSKTIEIILRDRMTYEIRQLLYKVSLYLKREKLPKVLVAQILELLRAELPNTYSFEQVLKIETLSSWGYDRLKKGLGLYR